jgi:hypothetical protein
MPLTFRASASTPFHGPLPRKRPRKRPSPHHHAVQFCLANSANAPQVEIYEQLKC